ncbi:MAG: D-alanine-D-alanine ligase, partial [Euryarchaeota archaeon]|nr:D-alanine-D-alanine ligase [Euryarchaeota archaeon]
GIIEKIDISCKLPESARRKSPAECAAEFEEEVESKSSMNSEDNREQSVFSDPSEAVQAFD